MSGGMFYSQRCTVRALIRLVSLVTNKARQLVLYY